MRTNDRSEDRTHYDLSDGYSLERADPKEFAIHAAIYLSADTRFELDWDVRLSTLVRVGESGYWIKQEGHRIGGVMLRPNLMTGLFLEPPFGDVYQVLRRLKRLLVHWSDKNADVNAVEIPPDQREYFHRLGFQLRNAVRCMIRPTETFDVSWGDDFVAAQPRKENEQEIARLMSEAFSHLGFGEMTLEEQTQSVRHWFVKQMEAEILGRASTLVYEKGTNRLVGACLIMLWQSWPVVYDVAVSPAFQGRGLATKMLQRALTVLKERYPVLRLNVTVKNPAESVYYNLGFLPGVEIAHLYIPAAR